MSEQSHLLNFNLFKVNDNNHSNPYNFNFNPTNHQRKASILTNSNNGFHHSNNDYYLPPIHQNNITFSSIIHHNDTVNNSTTQQTAIIINEKMTLPPPPPPPTKTPMHIVSPEAIREALKEEKEELLGHSQRRPFSQYSSFHALKQKRSNDDNNNHHPSFSIPFSPSPSVQLRNNDDFDEDIYEEEEVVVISPTTVLSEEEEEEEQEITKKEKLKRPPNAYLLFNRDMRRKLLKQSPKMTVAEISKNVGGWWKSLSDDKREYYVKEADLLKQEHLKKYPDFIYTRRSKAELLEAKKSSKLGRKLKVNTTEEVQHQQEPKTKKRKLALSNGQRDPRGRKKKRHKHPFAPKHPMSAYLYYLASVYPQVSLQFPGSTVGPISKSISQTWHAMSTEEQLPWKHKAEQDKARYAREMQAYMANNNQQKDTDPVDTQDVDLTTLSAVVNMVNNNNKL